MEIANIALAAALGAGALSFVAPCVLPLLPAYISYLSGTLAGQEEARARRRAFYHSLLFVLGFSLVFIFLGASAGLLGRTLNEYILVLRKVGGLLRSPSAYISWVSCASHGSITPSASNTGRGW